MQHQEHDESHQILVPFPSSYFYSYSIIKSQNMDNMNQEHVIQTDANSKYEQDSIELPSYQTRQTQMLHILHEYETMPLYLVTGFIRELGLESLDEIIIPQDLTNLCFKFYQHSDIAKLIDSKSDNELYCIAWEATENECFLFAEQITDYLIKKLSKKQQECKSEYASTVNLMAVIQYSMSNYAASEYYFQMASSLAPNCDIIMNNYAVLLLEQERFEDAENAILNAIKFNPECIKNHQQYAFILYANNKYELAAKECESMICKEPNTENHSGYAWLLEQMGMFKESCVQYKELTVLEPNNATWYFWHALSLQRCDEFEQSSLNFAKCLEIDEYYEGANGQYAYALYINGEYENALKYIQIAMSQPSDCEHLCVHYYYALILQALGNVQNAVNECYECLRMLSNGHKCSHKKGCLCIEEGHINDLLHELGHY